MLYDFFCSDFEAIKQQCLWMDEFQRWKLPEVTYLRLKLPPAVTGINSSNYDQYETVIETNEDEQTNNDRLLQVSKQPPFCIINKLCRIEMILLL